MKKKIIFLAIVLMVSLSILFEGCSTFNKSAASSKVKDVTRLTIEDIKKKYADVKLLSTNAIGTDFVLVESQRDTFANKFDIYNIKTGNMDTLPTAPSFVTLEKIENENYFIFLANGKNSESPFIKFPSLIRCIRINNEVKGTSNFITLSEDKYFNLAESVQAGSKMEGEMCDINIAFDAIQVLFGPIKGKEGGFYADATDIPPTKTSYQEDTKQLTFEIGTNQLADKLIKNKIVTVENNEYISSYEIVPKDNKLYLTLVVKDVTKEYMVKVNRLPHGSLPDGLVYFSVIFKN